MEKNRCEISNVTVIDVSKKDDRHSGNNWIVTLKFSDDVVISVAVPSKKEFDSLIEEYGSCCTFKDTSDRDNPYYLNFVTMGTHYNG